MKNALFGKNGPQFKHWRATTTQMTTEYGLVKPALEIVHEKCTKCMPSIVCSA